MNYELNFSNGDSHRETKSKSKLNKTSGDFTETDSQDQKVSQGAEHDPSADFDDHASSDRLDHHENQGAHKGNEEESSLEELVRSIAISLVDQVSRVQISEIQGHQTHIIELKVAKEDIGKVIGRQGRTADAIRTILNCASAKLSKRYILQIIDESKTSKPRSYS